MSKLFTSFRLPVLAVVTSLTMTSCFDKKCDPKPNNCGGAGKTTTTTTSTNTGVGVR